MAVTVVVMVVTVMVVKVMVMKVMVVKVVVVTTGLKPRGCASRTSPCPSFPSAGKYNTHETIKNKILLTIFFYFKK